MSKNKIRTFSHIKKSTDSDNNSVIEVTHIVQDSEIHSLPVEEKTFREMFTQAIANNCNEETFDNIGINLLLDDDLFQRYIAFKTIETRSDLESKWLLEAINVELNKEKPQPTNPSEITMTTEQTTQTQPKETTVNNTQTTQTNDATATPKATPTKPAAPITPSTTEGINWGGIGKTAGLFVGGAVVGAAGKWAWDHFFG